jgi:hypothetical protein
MKDAEGSPIPFHSIPDAWAEIDPAHGLIARLTGSYGKKTGLDFVNAEQRGRSFNRKAGLQPISRRKKADNPHESPPVLVQSPHLMFAAWDETKSY